MRYLYISYYNPPQWLYYIGLRFIARVIYIILNLNSCVYIYRADSALNNGFNNKLYKTLVFP